MSNSVIENATKLPLTSKDNFYSIVFDYSLPRVQLKVVFMVKSKLCLTQFTKEQQNAICLKALKESIYGNSQSVDLLDTDDQVMFKDGSEADLQNILANAKDVEVLNSTEDFGYIKLSSISEASEFQFDEYQSILELQELIFSEKLIEDLVKELNTQS